MHKHLGKRKISQIHTIAIYSFPFLGKVESLHYQDDGM